MARIEFIPARRARALRMLRTSMACRTCAVSPSATHV